MKVRPLISFVVPVYNVEKFLGCCLDSIVKQSFTDFEIIIIDDGSTDKSGKISDNYARKDTRVKVFHTKNYGLSEARNLGIENATGEYLFFVDSDDFLVSSDALSLLVKHLKNKPDLLVFPVKKFFDDNVSLNPTICSHEFGKFDFSKDYNVSILLLVKYNCYRSAAWNKVVKRSLVINNNLRFEKNVLSEDMEWCFWLLYQSSSILYINEPLYQYRQLRQGSITSTKKLKLVLDKINIILCLMKRCESLDGPKQTILMSYLAYEYCVLLGISYFVKDKIVIKKMYNMRELLKFDVSKKVKIVHLLSKLIGLRLTRRVLGVFVKRKK